MITVKVEYPWGEREIKYDKWVLRRLTKMEDTSTHMTVILKDETLVAKTQEEYVSLLRTFWNDWKIDMNHKEFMGYNSNYYEYSEVKHETCVEYIQGFLSENQ